MVLDKINQDDLTAREFKRLLLREFQGAAANSIFVDEQGDLTVFVHYRIIPDGRMYRVFLGATSIGLFSSNKTALSWCVADKFRDLKTAREILELDTKIYSLTNDINARAIIADKSRDLGFRENISTKLESKIIKKKALEKQLENRIKWTKYLQQRGFNNETERSSPKGHSKANR